MNGQRESKVMVLTLNLNAVRNVKTLFGINRDYNKMEVYLFDIKEKKYTIIQTNIFQYFRNKGYAILDSYVGNKKFDRDFLNHHCNKIEKKDRKMIYQYLKNNYQLNIFDEEQTIVKAGMPDYLLFKKENNKIKDLLFIELKTRNDTLSFKQILWMFNNSNIPIKIAWLMDSLDKTIDKAKAIAAHHYEEYAKKNNFFIPRVEKKWIKTIESEEYFTYSLEEKPYDKLVHVFPELKKVTIMMPNKKVIETLKVK